MTNHQFGNLRNKKDYVVKTVQNISDAKIVIFLNGILEDKIKDKNNK